jgi:hypothetical protein
MEVVIRWNKENKALLEEALHNAGIDAPIVETQQFEGAGEIIQVVVNIASLGIAFLKLLNERANMGKKDVKSDSLATIEILKGGHTLKITAPIEDIKKLVQDDPNQKDDKSS